MTKQEVLGKIQESGIVAVVRANSAVSAMQVCEAILDGGINCLEITLTVPDAINVIRDLNNKFGEQVLIGAGTVLDANIARDCIEAGSQFIVTPYLSLETIDFCRDSEKVVIAGALTPTEIFTAWKAGSDCVKVFPVNAVGGAGYLKSIQAPFPDIKLLPTGGINLENVSEFSGANIFAVGVGGELADANMLQLKGKWEITNLAHLYQNKFLGVRGRTPDTP